ncbi:IS4 family transposase, partial [Chryseobacterium pennae]
MGNSFRQGIAHTFSKQQLSPYFMLEDHRTNTIKHIKERCEDYIVIAQDTCIYNYTGHKKMEGIGKIQGNILGILQHNTLAFSSTGVALGIIHQQYWSRNSSVNLQGKESGKWLESMEKTNELAGEIKNKTLVMVQDREADFLEFFQREKAKNVVHITRIFQQRNFRLESEQGFLKLSDISLNAQNHGYKEIDIFRKGKHVHLKLSLRTAAVTLFHKGKKALEGHTLVIAEEVTEDHRNEQEKICWYLLTDLSVDSLEQANQVVDFYSLRWKIGLFHFTMKSGGYQVEKLQFDDVHTMINALTFYSIVSLEVLRLTYLVRESPSLPAKDFYTEKEIKLVERMSGKKIVIIKDFVIELSKSLAAFSPTKNYPFPGIKK